MSLIERLEKLQGPSREIDEAIAATLQTDGKMRVMWRPGAFCEMDAYIHPNGVRSPMLEYTAYVDAAMTLVPKGCMWDVGSNGPDDDGPWATVTSMTTMQDFSVHAPTPALALVTACLMARGG